MKKNSISSYFIFSLALGLATLTPTAHASVQTEFATALVEVTALFNSHYGAAEFKAKEFGWNSEREAARLTRLALAQGDALTLPAAQDLLYQFFESAKDYHAQAYFGSNPYIALPLGLHSARGRFFVTGLDDSYHGQIHVGDEVIRFDGKRVQEAIRELYPTQYPNTMTTDLRDTTRRLTQRYGALADPLPSLSTATIDLVRPNGEKYTEVLTWTTPANGPQVRTRRESHYPRVPSLVIGHADDPFGYSSRKSYLPKPSTVTEEAADIDLFYFWIGTSGKKRIGMIRVPTFYPDDFTAAIHAFAALIERMQANTDLLILDLQGNRGGVADYGNAILSYLYDQPVKTLDYSYRLFPELVDSFRTYKHDLEQITTVEEAYTYFGATDYFGYPITMDFVHSSIQMCQNELDDAAAGRKFGKPNFYNIRKITPATGARYLKPIVTMVDGWTVSEGDMFASTLRDTRRSKIVGVKTAGAGAFVGDWNTTSGALGLNFAGVPIALAYRINGNVLENHGIAPDFRIEPAPSDLFGANYADYAKRIYSWIDRNYK